MDQLSFPEPLDRLERRAISVRSAIAFGEWPPVDHSRCTPDTCEEVPPQLSVDGERHPGGVAA